ncbi:MAG TPA: helix-turn-helix domain-containing protein [Candidatus Angelobacter sp.]|jgi:excisionase family DNA binding protein|nr:helix-turn-helix domain-containing protein [Candidatus Angelobacter sp.]
MQQKQNSQPGQIDHDPKELLDNIGTAAYEPFITAEEAARFLGFNPKTIERWARQGLLPAHAFGTGRRKYWRFLLSELDVWRKSDVSSNRYPCRNSGGIL